MIPCDYCIKWDPAMEADHKCSEGVPWYCVSLGCNYFCDGEKEVDVPSPNKSSLNLKKVLVDTL
jgi:hypothetical protein